MTTRGAFVGPLGGLVEIAHYRGSMGTRADREVSFKRTLGGGLRGFGTPDRGLREWSVSAPGQSSAQVAPVEVLLASGPGPFHWVDPSAQMTNVLTPRKSLPGAGNEFAWTGSGVVAGGPVQAEGIGAVAHSVATNGSQVFLAWNTPVLPGVNVTGSVYATGYNGTSARIFLRFYKPDGTFTSTSGMGLVNQDATLRRVSVTGTPPAGSTWCLITVTGAGSVALPAVTWTPKLTPWGKGRGAAKAVVHGLSEDLRVVSQTQQVRDLSFTVTEVSNGA